MAKGKTPGSDIGLLIVRVVLGGIFVAHGVQQLTTKGGGLETLRKDGYM